MQWQPAVDSSGTPTLEFKIEESGGQRAVTGALWSPAADASNVLMVFGHGASRDRYQAPICHLAKRFTEQNISVLSMDGPVHGLRQVGPGGREALGQEFQRAECIDDMVTDWHLAIDAVKDRPELNIKHLAYFGLSMGSIFGIPLLASRNDVMVATLGLLGTEGAVSRFSERLLGDAKQIQMPVLFLMQLEDELFNRNGYLNLFDHLASEDKRLHANPGLHPEVPQEEIEFSFEFLMRYINGEEKPVVESLIGN